MTLSSPLFLGSKKDALRGKCDSVRRPRCCFHETRAPGHRPLGCSTSRRCARNSAPLTWTGPVTAALRDVTLRRAQHCPRYWSSLTWLTGTLPQRRGGGKEQHRL
ncbi:hypothetical protein SRHO_G00198270 [Serrasalmus rhombeus]